MNHIVASDEERKFRLVLRILFYFLFPGDATTASEEENKTNKR